jgi:uncharacterized protein with NRDE domain
MCTLLIATQVWGETPLVIAANRDEALARASAGPELREERGMRIVAPRDLEGGGTWLGLNAAGIFVAITNRHNGVRHADARSRGQLVLDALAEHTVEDAVRHIASLDPQMHNPFHLVVADAARADLVWSDGHQYRHDPLAAGITVVTERSFGAAPTGRIGLLEARVEGLASREPPAAEAWMELLREHRDDAPLEGVCVHAPALGYGTRSSTVLMLNRDPRQSVFLHADGPPCTTTFEDRSAMIRSLVTPS